MAKLFNGQTFGIINQQVIDKICEEYYPNTFGQNENNELFVKNTFRGDGILKNISERYKRSAFVSMIGPEDAFHFSKMMIVAWGLICGKSRELLARRHGYSTVWDVTEER